MIVPTKLLNYLQDFIVGDSKRPSEGTHLHVWPVNHKPKHVKKLYTLSADRDKQRMDAMQRHPSAQTRKRDK